MLMLNKINKDSIIKRRHDLDCTDLDGEVVMMDLDEGLYFSLNSVASDIWSMIETDTSVSKVITNLLSQYDIDEKTCHLNVIDFLGKLNDCNLITIR